MLRETLLTVVSISLQNTMGILFLLNGQLSEGRHCICHLPFQHLGQYLAHSRYILLLKCLLILCMVTQTQSPEGCWDFWTGTTVSDDLIANEHFINDSQCVRYLLY